MKQLTFSLLLLLPLLLLDTFCHGQHILKSGAAYGLSAPDGAILLPLEYDTVYQAESRFQSSIWICRKNGKFGLYNFSDNWFSGVIFEEVKTAKYSGIVTMRQGDKWGFMTLQGGAGDEETTTVFPTRFIAPRYDAVWSEGGLNYSQRFLYVKDQQRYGVLSAYNGDTLVPIRFAASLREFEYTSKLPMFISGQYSDNANDSMYVYNPNTNATMAFHDRSKLEVERDYTFLTSANNYYDNLHGMVEVYNYETGERLFHIVIPPDTAVCTLHQLSIEILNYKTIKVLLQHSMKQGVSDHYTINCYDIYSGYRHFEYEGPKYVDLELKLQNDESFYIYRRVNYNKYLEKDVIGLKKTDGSIIWYYERFRKP